MAGVGQELPRDQRTSVEITAMHAVGNYKTKITNKKTGLGEQ
jgi:hypothetical protein